MIVLTKIANWLRALRSLGFTRARVDEYAAELARTNATIALLATRVDESRTHLENVNVTLASLATKAEVDESRTALANVDVVIASLATRSELDASRIALDNALNRLTGELEQVRGALAGRGRDIDERLAALRAELSRLADTLQAFQTAHAADVGRLDGGQRALAQRIDPPLPRLARAGDSNPSEWLYAAFEETFRGSRDEIAARLAVHVPDMRSAVEATGGKPIADVGCGRGEWIERLRDEGLLAWGVDINPEVVAGGKARGLDVRLGNGVDALDAQEPGSLATVTAFHVVEHLPLAEQLRLMVAAHRALAAGGVMIVETPNPENLLVGAWTFYMDPTHLRPLPPSLLRFLMEVSGFEIVAVRRLHPDDAFVERAKREGWPAGLVEILGGPRDYAIVARRP